MKRKNIILLSIIIVLIFANILLLIDSPVTSSMDYDPTLFAIEDTTLINEIQISSTGRDINMKRVNGWILNDKYPSDPNVLRLFKAVSQRVRIVRKLSVQEVEDLNDQRFIGDVNVLIDDSDLTYGVYGNAMATKTFFLLGKEGFEVEIPGYTDFVGAVYQLTEDQWRDRLIFNGNWRSIQKILIDYEGTSSDLTITFKESFFEVEGIEELDSNFVVSYLNEYEYLQANERISKGRFPKYDSLSQTEVFTWILVDDIKYREPLTIRIFPKLPNERVRLVLDPEGEMTVFEENRIQNLLKTPVEFRY